MLTWLAGHAWLQFLDPPDYSLFKFDPTQWAGPYLEPDAARTAKMLSNAATFAGIWATGDPSPADKIMSPDVKDQNLMFGGAKAGRQSWKDTILAAFKVMYLSFLLHAGV